MRGSVRGRTAHVVNDSEHGEGKGVVVWGERTVEREQEIGGEGGVCTGASPRMLGEKAVSLLGTG